MSDFILYTILLIVFLSLFFFYCKVRLNRVLPEFLSAHNNIMILATGKKITMINEKGLKVFGYKTLKEFMAAHADIADFFLDHDKDNSIYKGRSEGIQYIDKYTHGKKWLEAVSKSKEQQVKVKIFSKEDELEKYYQIRVSKLHDGHTYSLSFTDISKLEGRRLKTQEKAEFDPLTRIYNRLKVNEILDDMALNAQKHDHDLTLILFDIDHFKSVNDNYGHNVGDSVLRELARLVQGLVRKEDVFARWGGEEFIVLLHNTSLQQTTQLASRLRQEVEKFHFTTIGDVRCSFGVTQFTSADTTISFLERVDVALYEAKENGRNQVVTK